MAKAVCDLIPSRLRFRERQSNVNIGGITVFGPCQENDFSVANGKKQQSNQLTKLPKCVFAWLAEE